MLYFSSFSQAVYIPSKGSVTAKPIAPSAGVPTDARSYFYDSLNFRWRPYLSTSEVTSFLSSQALRRGHFPIIVNTGGTLSNGVITGGTNTEYWFKDGITNSDLVVKGGASSSPNVTGTLSQLRATTTATTGQVFFLSDYGGGFFINRGLNDGVHSDNTATIVLDAGGHWWERQQINELDVLWFGAVLDGFTDNLAPFISMINYANSVGGNVRFTINRGRMRIGEAVGVPNITSHNVFFVGKDPLTSWIVPTKGNYFKWKNPGGYVSGGGFENIRIQYYTPDSAATCTFDSAFSFRSNNVMFYNGTTFLDIKRSSDFVLNKTSAIFANKGLPLIRMKDGAGFKWADHDGVSQMEAVVPEWNRNSVMNVVPGTNIIDILGSWDSFELNLFAEKVYRVVNVDFAQNSGAVLFHASIHNCTADYIKDDVFHFENHGSGNGTGANGTFSNIEIKDNYMASWEGHGVRFKLDGGILAAASINGNETVFTGKSAVDITTTNNANPRYININNNRFIASSRLGPQYPTVHLTSTAEIIMNGNNLGGGIINNPATDWMDSTGLIVNSFNYPDSVRMSGNIIHNYSGFTGNVKEGYWKKDGGTITNSTADPIVITAPTTINSYNVVRDGIFSNSFLDLATNNTGVYLSNGETSIFGSGNMGGRFTATGQAVINNTLGVGLGTGRAALMPFEVKVSAGLHAGFMAAQQNPAAVELNAFNEDGSANIPLEFRATGYNFRVSPVSVLPAILPEQAVNLGQLTAKLDSSFAAHSGGTIDESNLVHKTGDESISNEKTFAAIRIGSFQTFANNTGIGWGYGDGTTAILANSAAGTGSMKFYTANVERLRLGYAGEIVASMPVTVPDATQPEHAVNLGQLTASLDNAFNTTQFTLRNGFGPGFQLFNSPAPNTGVVRTLNFLGSNYPVVTLTGDSVLNMDFSDFAHLSGTQTFSGQKTFTASTFFSGQPFITATLQASVVQGDFSILTRDNSSGRVESVPGSRVLNSLTVLPEFANNAIAVDNGLANGDFYRTGDVVKQVHP